MADGFFRCKEGFTVVQNPIVRDKRISLKAKGLYLVIQSYITMPDKQWKKSDFMAYIGEGTAVFESAWKELLNNGYLHMHRVYNGSRFVYEFELLDQATEGPYQFFYNQKGELTKTNLGMVETEEDDTRGVSLMEPTTMEPTPMEPTPMEPTPMEPTPMEPTPMEPTPMEPTSMGPIPMKSNTMESIPTGIRPDNIKTYIENKECENNTSINQSNTYIRANVNMDEIMEVEEIDRINKYLNVNKGISVNEVSDINKIEKYMLALVYANYQADRHSYTGMYDSAYRLVINSLTEMIVNCTPIEGKKDVLTNYDVIIQLNQIINDDNPMYSVALFVALCAERYCNYAMNHHVQNPKKYIKTLIWNNFSTFRVDWEGYLVRNINGNT